MTAPRIALLDNAPSFLAQMRALLTVEGYRTLRCRPRDVRSVHALVKWRQPALVILDRWWRRTDGWEFLTDLWADPATVHIGVVLACGQTLPSSLHTEILRATRCQIVRNPLDRDELLHAMTAVVAPTPLQRERGPRRPVPPFAAPAVPDLLDISSSRRARTDDAHFSPFPFSRAVVASPHRRTLFPSFARRARWSQRGDRRVRRVPSLVLKDAAVDPASRWEEVCSSARRMHRPSQRFPVHVDHRPH